MEASKYLTEVLADMPTADYNTMEDVLGRRKARITLPDLTIAPDGEPYLYRWHLVRTEGASVSVYLHLQVRSDPERPLHDHPWHNTSVILAGGYHEYYKERPPFGPEEVRHRGPGDVVSRHAELAHRLVLPEGQPYCLTLFTTGPKIRSWGFWYPDGWHHWKAHVVARDGVSVHTNREKA